MHQKDDHFDKEIVRKGTTAEEATHAMLDTRRSIQVQNRKHFEIPRTLLHVFSLSIRGNSNYDHLRRKPNVYAQHSRKHPSTETEKYFEIPGTLSHVFSLPIRGNSHYDCKSVSVTTNKPSIALLALTICLPSNCSSVATG